MKHIKSQLHNNKQGLAIVLLMIILVVATAIGIWGLTSSRSSMLKAGSRKFATELTYQAEQGLQKAVRRIQSIATNTGSDDQVAATNMASTSSGRTGQNDGQKSIGFLVDPNTASTGGLCADGGGSCSGATNQACTGFDALKNFDAINANVICNFLGVIDSKTQVSVVRKADLITGTDRFAILLVNSVATDTNGRKQAIQGVVVVPYDPAGPSSTGTPYLASSKAVTD